jgi:hypothetical protein
MDNKGHQRLSFIGVAFFLLTKSVNGFTKNVGKYSHNQTSQKNTLNEH